MERKFRKLGFLFVLTGSMFLYSCGNSDEESKETTEETTEESVDSEDVLTDDTPEVGEGYLYSTTNGDYDIVFPVKPKESTENIPITSEMSMTMHMVMHEDVSNEEVYMTAYSELPAQLVEMVNDDVLSSMLHGGKQGAVQELGKYGSTEPQIDFEEDFMYDGKYQAVKFKAHNGEHYVYAKFFYKDGALYQIMKGKIGDYSNPDKADRFFNSFKLN